MSVKAAMCFIQTVESDDGLKDAIRAMGHDVSLEQIVELAAQQGLEFSVEDLRAAFAKDWEARWAYYSARSSR